MVKEFRNVVVIQAKPQKLTFENGMVKEFRNVVVIQPKPQKLAFKD